MLTIQKLREEAHLTENEATVAQFLLNNQHRIHALTVTEIAAQTFTSPSTTVRLAQKLGFSGFKDFKINLLKERHYIDSHASYVNANYPFSNTDKPQEIAQKIAQLLSESIYDTLNILDYEQLDACISLLARAKQIIIYGLANAIAPAYDFSYKMRALYKTVHLVNNFEDFAHMVDVTGPETVSVFISYSGETVELIPSILSLKQRHLPTIAITSMGGNSFSRLCNHHLLITTREKLASKIATYTSNEGIHFILDLLYSCLFSLHYDKNLSRKKRTDEKRDSLRTSSVLGIKEN